MKKNLRTASICVQGGYKPKNGEPIELPIIQSTTFKYDNSEEMAMLFDLKKEGYFYTRLQNPTNDAVAKKIAQLEGGVGAVLTWMTELTAENIPCQLRTKSICHLMTEQILPPHSHKRTVKFRLLCLNITTMKSHL